MRGGGGWGAALTPSSDLSLLISTISCWSISASLTVLAGVVEVAVVLETGAVDWCRLLVRTLFIFSWLVGGDGAPLYRGFTPPLGFGEYVPLPEPIMKLSRPEEKPSWLKSGAVEDVRKAILPCCLNWAALSARACNSKTQHATFNRANLLYVLHWSSDLIRRCFQKF